MSRTWDEFFIKMAMHVATKSKDPSTKVGCIIVGPDNEVRSTGYNGFPRGVRETTDVRQHKPVEIEKMFAGGYQVACSCGDIIQLGGARQGNWDTIPEDPMHVDQNILRSQIETHEHFSVPDVQIDPERWARPMKYDLVEHAERNAVYNVARVGIPIAGCRAYLNWEPYPCKECAKAFIQAGIIEVIGPDIEFPNHKKKDGKDQWDSGEQWKFTVSQMMMDEAGVEYRRVPWEVS